MRLAIAALLWTIGLGLLAFAAYGAMRRVKPRPEPLVFKDITEEQVNEIWAKCVPIWQADPELHWPTHLEQLYDVEQEGL